MATDNLSETATKSATPPVKAYKLTAGDGMFACETCRR